MTFIPSVLSKRDNNNSTTTASNFSGLSTETTGYTNLIITITAIFKKSIVFSNKNIVFLNISVKTIKHQPSL